MLVVSITFSCFVSLLVVACSWIESLVLSAVSVFSSVSVSSLSALEFSVGVTLIVPTGFIFITGISDSKLSSEFEFSCCPPS